MIVPFGGMNIIPITAQKAQTRYSAVNLSINIAHGSIASFSSSAMGGCHSGYTVNRLSEIIGACSKAPFYASKLGHNDNK